MNRKNILYNIFKYVLLLSLMLKAGNFIVEYTTLFTTDENSLSIDTNEDVEVENENESEPENKTRETNFIESLKISLTVNRIQKITNHFFFVDISYSQRHIEYTTPPPELT